MAKPAIIEGGVSFSDVVLDAEKLKVELELEFTSGFERPKENALDENAAAVLETPDAREFSLLPPNFKPASESREPAFFSSLENKGVETVPNLKPSLAVLTVSVELVPFKTGSMVAPETTPNLNSSVMPEEEPPNLMSADPKVETEEVLPNLKDPVLEDESEKLLPNFISEAEFEELVPNLNPAVLEMVFVEGVPEVPEKKIENYNPLTHTINNILVISESLIRCQF